MYSFTYPYVYQLSGRINKTLGEYDMALGCKAENNIGNVLFSKMTYPIPKNMKSKVVYRVDCLDRIESIWKRIESKNE